MPERLAQPMNLSRWQCQRYWEVELQTQCGATAPCAAVSELVVSGQRLTYRLTLSSKGTASFPGGWHIDQPPPARPSSSQCRWLSGVAVPALRLACLGRV